MGEDTPVTQGPATIADVARRAGVAKSTVSNYLRGLVRVAPETSLRIARAIADLEYQPAESARSLTSRKRTIQRLDRMEADLPALTTVGHVSVDFIARLDRLPSPEERVMGQEILKAVGGPAANVAAFAAGLSDRWKLASSLLTVVGNDVDSDWAVTELARRGVETLTPSGRREGRLARALVLVEPDGRRTIVAEPVSVGAVELDLFLAAHGRPNRPWCVHFEGFQVPAQLTRARVARKAGFRTSMDTTGLSGSWVATHREEIFSAFDVVVIHQESLAGLSGNPPARQDTQEWLLDYAAGARDWPEIVIVSYGVEGGYLIERGETVTHCRNTDVEVKDETGAADALVGTFLALWMNGVPGVAALNGACAAALLVATEFGAQELRPSGDAIVHRVASAETNGLVRSGRVPGKEQA
jgi:ribokinase